MEFLRAGPAAFESVNTTTSQIKDTDRLPGGGGV
jgi:hypothetical protein